MLVSRQRPHLVARFLDYLDRSAALLVVNPDVALLASSKGLIRKQAERGYSFVDCLSFCLMRERRIREALTSDEHFRRAGFEGLLLLDASVLGGPDFGPRLKDCVERSDCRSLAALTE